MVKETGRHEAEQSERDKSRLESLIAIYRENFGSGWEEVFAATVRIDYNDYFSV